MESDIGTDSKNLQLPVPEIDAIHAELRSIVTREELRVQKLLETYSSSQRENLDALRGKVDQLLARLPEKLEEVLEKSLRSPLIRDDTSDGSPQRMVSPMSFGTSPSENLPKKLKRAISVHEEYIQIKERQRKNCADMEKCCSAAHRRCSSSWSQVAHGHHRLPLERFRKFVHGTTFSAVALILILANTVLISLTSDAHVKSLLCEIKGEPWPMPSWYTIADIVLLASFTVELLLRLVADEILFFIGPDWKWNLFDVFIVLSSVADTVSHLADLGFMRAMRSLRVLRSIRVIRVVRFFRELRVLLLHIVHSMVPMVWAFVFLGLVLLTFSLVFLQGVIMYFEDVVAGAASFSLSGNKLEELFGSFGMANLSLFMAITGGINWWNIVDPLGHVSPFYTLLFSLYILVLTVGVLNIMVGIFVESANEVTHLDREVVTQAAIEKNAAIMKELEALFAELDKDHTGRIGRKDFEAWVSKPEVRAYFSVLDLDVLRAHEVFSMIDADHTGCVHLDEFVVGIMRLKGMAKAIDMENLMFETGRLLKQVRSHRQWVAERFDRLEGLLAPSLPDQEQQPSEMDRVVTI